MASPRQPARIARAIPALVMREHDVLGEAQHLVVVHAGQRLGLEQRVVAERGVLLHLRVFAGGELTRLVQDRVGDADLADVVERRQRGDEVDAVRRQVVAVVAAGGDRRGEQARVLLGASGVTPGLDIAGLGERGQRLHDQALGLVAAARVRGWRAGSRRRARRPRWRRRRAPARRSCSPAIPARRRRRTRRAAPTTSPRRRPRPAGLHRPRRASPRPRRPGRRPRPRRQVPAGGPPPAARPRRRRAACRRWWRAARRRETAGRAASRRRRGRRARWRPRRRCGRGRRPAAGCRPCTSLADRCG